MTPLALTAAERRLQRLIGVTRIGRVTGLDRAGIEVACAIRPSGHILQVSNGKGSNFTQAARTALYEATELWAAEQVNPTKLVFASRDELLRAGDKDAWDAGELGSAGGLLVPALWSNRTRICWQQGTDLMTGRKVWIPAQAVYCPPAGAPLLGPCVVKWTSNGMGAHPRRNRAIVHALLEAAERDQLARALPSGWTRQRLASRMLTRRSIQRVAPGAGEVLSQLSARGFDAWLFDVSHEGRGTIGLPVAGALLVDRELGPNALTAGYACRLSVQEALMAAIFEAAQSRLTDIHGAREDVTPGDPTQSKVVWNVCRGLRGTRSAAQMAAPDAAGKTLNTVLRVFRQAGIGRVAAVDLAPPGLPVQVVKVVVAQFKCSELL